MTDIWIDGACSGNPGAGAAGFVVLRNGQELARGTEKLKGLTTSNCAEFHALWMALDYIENFLGDFYDGFITIYTDSSLVYGLMNNLSVAHSGDYIPYFEKAYTQYHDLLKRRWVIQISWVARERNELVNGMVQKLIYSGKYRKH